MTTANFQGTRGYLDPIYTNSGQQSEITDAFGIGITLLMCLTGLPGDNLLQKCRTLLKKPDKPSTWKAPAVPDPTAGEWPEETAVGLAELAVGLAFEHFAEDRTPLAEAIEKLEELCAAHPPPAAGAAGSAATHARASSHHTQPPSPPPPVAAMQSHARV